MQDGYYGQVACSNRIPLLQYYHTFIGTACRVVHAESRKRKAHRSFTVHRAQLSLTVRTELKRYIQVFKLILPATILQNVLYILWVISFIFTTYVNSKIGLLWTIILICRNVSAVLIVPLWILWQLKRADHQQSIPIIELINNPGTAADLHNAEFERNWQVKPQSPR